MNPSKLHADPESLAQAIADGALDQADLLLSSVRTPWARPVLALAAELHLRKRRWRDSAECFARIDGRDVDTEMRRRMVVNLAALQIHRPEVYQVLLNCPGNPGYTLSHAPDGLPINIYQGPDGRKISLTPGTSPLAALNKIRQQFGTSLSKGETLALCGIGDGYFLHALAQQPPKLLLDTEQVIYVIESEPQVVLNCLMMHDYSGPSGPIEQKRFSWFIGSSWCDAFGQALLDDLYKPMPTVSVSQAIDAESISEKLAAVGARLNRLDEALRGEVEAYCSGLEHAELAELFSTDRPRRPRVLLLSTRFSTVLQHSIRHSAEAFEQIGCQTHIVIEPTAHHRLSKPAIRKALRDFKPDLVFQIDHLRAEHADVFPAKLPFCCWIQEHLPNLTNQLAGKSVTSRDFVLSGMSNYFATAHQYPKRQLISLPQLGRVPIRPTHWTSTGDDLACVSNASNTTATAMQELRQRWAGHDPDVMKLIEHVSVRLARTYDSAASLATHIEVRGTLLDSERELNLPRPLNAAGMHLLVESIFDRLNSTLYRQQALGWAADVAGELGLKFALYGHGWENHPRFAAFARGPVAAGAALENLTRRTRLNLQVEPYACFTRTRLLTGIFAGGFFLVRDHPSNHLTQELSGFLHQHGSALAETNAEARAMVDPAGRPDLEQLLTRCQSMAEHGDCIALVRDWERCRLLVPGAQALPRMDEILFNDRAGLKSLVERFVNDADARSQIVDEQRESTEGRLSYVNGLRRVLREISQTLASEGAQPELRKCA